MNAVTEQGSAAITDRGLMRATPARRGSVKPRALVAAIAVLSPLLAVTTTAAAPYHSKTDPSAPGGLRGKIVSESKLQRVIVVEPFEVKAYEAQVNAGEGTFRITGLPVGEYDLLVKTVGHAWEGLTLRALPGEPPSAAVIEKATDGVGKSFFKSEAYFNVKRIVRLMATGNEDGDRARMLAIQTRTQEVVNPAGDKLNAHIRRFDYVLMRKTRRVWRVASSHHLLRQEVPKGSDDIEIEMHYSPKLGGLLVSDGVKDLGRIVLRKLPTPPTDRFGSKSWREKK